MQFSVFLWAVLLSILPVFELRGGIIYAVLAGVNPFTAFFVCTIANMIIIFFIFFFLDFLHKRFMKISLYKKVFGFYVERLRRKAEKLERKMDVYGFLALTIFVAIPLPGTGAWTGCLIAWLLGLDRKKSIISIAFGVLIAGIIVLSASLGIINLLF
jgi:uncharacterized membrane protein